jgi:hypothetical protein
MKDFCLLASFRLIYLISLSVMGRTRQRIGCRIERELVQLHKDIGVHAERYPLSGASHFRGAGHDIDIYARGRDVEIPHRTAGFTNNRGSARRAPQLCRGFG